MDRRRPRALTRRLNGCSAGGGLASSRAPTTRGGLGARGWLRLGVFRVAGPLLRRLVVRRLDGSVGLTGKGAEEVAKKME